MGDVDCQDVFLASPFSRKRNGGGDGESLSLCDEENADTKRKKTLFSAIEITKAAKNRKYSRVKRSKETLKRLERLDTLWDDRAKGRSQYSCSMEGMTEVATKFTTEFDECYVAVKRVAVNSVQYLVNNGETIFIFENKSPDAVEVTGAVNLLMNYYNTLRRPSAEEIASKAITANNFASTKDVEAAQAEALKEVAKLDIGIIDDIYKAAKNKDLDAALTTYAGKISDNFRIAIATSTDKRTSERFKVPSGGSLWHGFMLMTSIAMMKTYEPGVVLGDELSVFMNAALDTDGYADHIHGLAFLLFGPICQKSIASLSNVLRSVKNKRGFINTMLKGNVKTKNKQKCQPALFPWLQVLCRVSLLQYVSFPIAFNAKYLSDSLEESKQDQSSSPFGDRQDRYLVSLCEYLLGTRPDGWGSTLTFVDYAATFQSRHSVGFIVKSLVRSSQAATKSDNTHLDWYDTVIEMPSGENQDESSVPGSHAASVTEHQLDENSTAGTSEVKADPSDTVHDSQYLNRQQETMIKRCALEILRDVVCKAENPAISMLTEAIDCLLQSRFQVVSTHTTEAVSPDETSGAAPRSENPTPNATSLFHDKEDTETVNEGITETHMTDAEVMKNDEQPMLDAANRSGITNQAANPEPDNEDKASLGPPMCEFIHHHDDYSRGKKGKKRANTNDSTDHDEDDATTSSQTSSTHDKNRDIAEEQAPKSTQKKQRRCEPDDQDEDHSTSEEDNIDGA